VTNNGPEEAEDVTWTDNLPAGFTLGSLIGFSGQTGGETYISNHQSQTLIAELLSIASGASKSVSFTVTVPGQAGSYTNAVAVSSSTQDPDPNNNTGSASVQVNAPQADLSVTKTGPTSAEIGDEIAYDITVHNGGPDAAMNVAMDEVVSSGLQVLGTTVNNGWICTFPGPQALRCTAASFAAGDTVTFTVTLQVNGAGHQTDIATVTSDTADPDTTNDSASVIVLTAARVEATGVDVRAVEGIAFAGPVATFTDNDPNATAADFNASIDWGDGTRPSAGTISGDPVDGYTVTGTHTYAEEGTFGLTVTITDEGGSTATANSSADVADAALHAQPALAQALTEGALFTGMVATFTDDDPAGTATDYTADIEWGDGTTSTGTVSAIAGGFQVTGSHTYAEEGQYAVSVVIADHPSTAVTTQQVTVQDAPLDSIGAGLLSGVEGATFDGQVASFVDADPDGMVSDYTATIDWGDLGAPTLGTIVPSPLGVFHVSGSHTYAEEGLYFVVVTITDAGGSTTSTFSVIQVADAPLTVTAVDIHGVEGQAFTAVVAHYTDADPHGDLADYSAIIDWGDGSSSAGAFTADSIIGTHRYVEEGAYSVTVFMSDAGGANASGGAGANVDDAALRVQGTSIHATEGATFAGIVAAFSDDDPFGQLFDYTATIDWGDGTSSAGFINGAGTFVVYGVHTYLEEGDYHVTVTVDDLGGASATAITHAIVEDAPLTSIGVSYAPTALAAFNGNVATFSDADPNGVASDYTVTIDWGDGATSAGSAVAAGSAFAAQGAHTYASGVFTITVSIHDVGGASTNATSHITVDVAPPVTTANLTGTLGDHGWWKSLVSLTLVATDNLAGVAATYFTINGSGALRYVGPLVLTEGVYALRYWSVDALGNVETANSLLVEVDYTAPTVSITGVTDGARYMLGSMPVAGFTPTDATSGVASSSGVLTPPGTASGAGGYSFTATATDVAGNATTVTVHYVVDYFFGGLRLIPGSSINKAGKDITIRFQLFNTFGAQVVNGAASLLVDGAPATPGNGSTGNAFRYDPIAGAYVYRMDTNSVSAGMHLLTIVLDDGTRREVPIYVAVAAPALILSAPSTHPGSAETVSGSGFAAFSLVTIRFNGVVVGTTQASASGAFTFTFTIPVIAPLGVSTIVADGFSPGGARLLTSGALSLT
jgi:uncharacterized repeat protein (TIGR01451 family)